MFLAASAAAIALQLVACTLSAAGWGYWIYRLCGRPQDERGTAPLLCMVAGGCAGWLILQDLLPIGAELRWSAPVGALAAVAGWVGWGRAYNNHLRGAVRVVRSAGLVLVAVFTFQAAGLIRAGPRDYYGYARQDQVNYVQLAQFLVEQPFALPRSEVGLHPWLVKGTDTKSERIGQSVANGYLAAVTGTDASRAYGTTSIFFVALIALTVAGCLLSFGVCPLFAWLGGIWAGVLPGLTQMHLDGFFSQTSTVFCFAGIAWSLRLAGTQLRLAAGTSALFLAFLLSAYSEEFILGLAFAWALVWGAPGLSRRRQAALTAFLTAAPVISLSPFAAPLARFIGAQYQSARHAEALAVWQPRAGTWRGWNELFLAAPSHSGLLLGLAVAAGGGLLTLAVLGGVSVRGTGCLQRAVLAIFPAAVLGALVWTSRPHFPAYTFGKLAVSFSPLAVILIVLALALTSLRLIRAQIWLLPALIVFAGWSSWTKLAVVWHNGAGLPTMNSPQARAVYRELDAHPERTYVITEPHGMLNAWFAYHARHADVYSTVPIGDSSMRADDAFLRRPPAGVEVWEVSSAGVKRR